MKETAFHTQTRGKILSILEGNSVLCAQRKRFQNYWVSGLCSLSGIPDDIKVQKPSNSECYTPLSEPFKRNVLHTHEGKNALSTWGKHVGVHLRKETAWETQALV
jgi:hypothetical protein